MSRAAPMQCPILDLAILVQQVAQSNQPVIVRKKANLSIAATRYVPSIDRAKRELNLSLKVDLPEAINKTLQWYRAHGSAFH